jgi:hypothetical protein
MGCMAADRINGQITVTKIDKARHQSILVTGERSNAGRYVAIHLKSLTGWSLLATRSLRRKGWRWRGRRAGLANMRGL